MAALAGAGIPLLLRRLLVDPALAGGVVLTTLTDVVGFMTFLGLGALFLIRAPGPLVDGAPGPRSATSLR